MNGRARGSTAKTLHDVARACRPSLRGDLGGGGAGAKGPRLSFLADPRLDPGALQVSSQPGLCAPPSVSPSKEPFGDQVNFPGSV